MEAFIYKSEADICENQAKVTKFVSLLNYFFRTSVFTK